jgi:hypothetical protein
VGKQADFAVSTRGDIAHRIATVWRLAKWNQRYGRLRGDKWRMFAACTSIDNWIASVLKNIFLVSDNPVRS